VRVLRRLAGLDVHQLDLLFDRPGQEVPAGQLWSVVTANRLRAGGPGPSEAHRKMKLGAPGLASETWESKTLNRRARRGVSLAANAEGTDSVSGGWRTRALQSKPE
jgi:hypothetical protein